MLVLAIKKYTKTFYKEYKFGKSKKKVENKTVKLISTVMKNILKNSFTIT